MPKVKYSAARGLHQVAGKGIAGLEGIAFSDNTTIAVAQGNNDLTVKLPANAMIIDLGLVCTTVIDSAASSTVSLDFGTTAGGAELTAQVQINNTGDDIAAGVVISSLMGNIAHTSGNAVGTFKQAAPLFSTSARTITGRVVVGGANLTTAGKARIFARYVVVEDSVHG